MEQLQIFAKDFFTNTALVVLTYIIIYCVIWVICEALHNFFKRKNEQERKNRMAERVKNLDTHKDPIRIMTKEERDQAICVLMRIKRDLNTNNNGALYIMQAEEIINKHIDIYMEHENLEYYDYARP